MVAPKEAPDAVSAREPVLYPGGARRPARDEFRGTNVDRAYRRSTTNRWHPVAR